MSGSTVKGECTVGCSERCNLGVIICSGYCKFGDGFNRFILIGVIGCLMGVIGRLEDGTGSGGLQLPPLLVGSCKEFLEACPGLVVSWLAPPEFAVVIEESGLEQELESHYDNLGRGVGRVSGGGVVHRIFDLIDEGFERLIAVVRIPESRAVVL